MTPIHISQWALSPKNNKIPLYHHPNVDPETQCYPLLMIGGVHGDEPEGVRLAEDLLSWLQNENQSELRPWILIPCLNPDGYAESQRMNGRGVDLNRNYPSKNWSPKSDGPRYFPGTSAGSEPEIQALCNLIQTVKPEVIIHFHSWEPMVVLSGPDRLKEAEALSKASGYPIKSNIGYPTPGALSQYGWGDHKIPVICIEEQEKMKDLNTIWPRFKKGFVEIIKTSWMR